MVEFPANNKGALVRLIVFIEAPPSVTLVNVGATVFSTKLRNTGLTPDAALALELELHRIDCDASIVLWLPTYCIL